MADSKITALAALTAADPVNDMFPVVDVSDTSMAASGTTKRISVNNILSSSPTASGALTVTGLVTAGSATITGDLTVDTSTLKVDSANNRVGVVNASPSFALDVNGAGSGVSARISSGSGTGFRFDTTRNISGLNRNYLIGCDVLNEGWFSIVPSTALGGGTFTNPIYNASYDGIHAWSDGAGSERMRLNSTGLGVGGSPVNFPNYTTIHAIGKTTTTGGVFQTSTSNNSTAARFACSSAGVDLFVETNHPLAFYTNAIERMRIDAVGNVGIGVTPSGSGGCLQLKSGITFPATQVASSDANTLDDYEEGTWTGTLTGSTTNPTVPVTATGRYTKIGRQVSISINFESISTVGALGNIGISGLPFANNASVQSIGPTSIYQAGTFTGSPFTRLDTAASAIEFFASVSSAVYSNVTHNAGTGRFIATSITYTVA